VKILRVIAAGALSGFLVISLSVPVIANADSVVVKTITTAPGISIDTSLYLPSQSPAPAILIAHGFGGTKDSVEADAKYFRDKGFAVLTWTARGFGDSTGQIEMNSIGAEVSDTRELISYLAKNQKVKQDKTGDPLVGIMGSSYGGARFTERSLPASCRRIKNIRTI